MHDPEKLPLPTFSESLPAGVGQDSNVAWAVILEAEHIVQNLDLSYKNFVNEFRRSASFDIGDLQEDLFTIDKGIESQVYGGKSNEEDIGALIDARYRNAPDPTRQRTFLLGAYKFEFMKSCLNNGYNYAAADQAWHDYIKQQPLIVMQKAIDHAHKQDKK